MKSESSALPSFRRVRTISDSESTEPPDLVCTEETTHHHTSRDNLNAMNAFILCFIWCSISVVNNIVSKTLLTAFPYPLTSTLAQLFLTAVCAFFVNLAWDIPPIHWKFFGTKYTIMMILPLGFGKFLAAVGTHISVSKLPVSYAHTVKATMPIFVVIISTAFFGEHYSIKIYSSLFIIFIGVGIASVTELSFNVSGLISALIATMAFALLNILAKKCLNSTRMHQFRLLQLLSQIATIIFLPIWMYSDLSYFLSVKHDLTSLPSWKFWSLLVSDGVLNFSQNLIAFTLIAKITAVSYAVANVTKRIAVIVLSILFFGNPVTLVNIFGMMLAIFGVLVYNLVKTKNVVSTKPVIPLLKVVEHRLDKTIMEEESADKIAFNEIHRHSLDTNSPVYANGDVNINSSRYSFPIPRPKSQTVLHRMDNSHSYVMPV